MQIGAIRALAALALAGLAGGCTLAGPLGRTDGTGARTGTGCGGEVLTVPVGQPACSHGPMTAPTPYPVSDEVAIASAERFLGATGLGVYTRDLAETPAVLLTGPDAATIVDGATGRVLQVFAHAPDIAGPDGAPPDWSSAPSAAPSVQTVASAIAAARAWLQQRAVQPAPGRDQARLDDGDPAARAWVVTLRGPDGRVLDLRVAPDGRVVGYQVEGTPLGLSLPRYSRDAAIAIAIAKVRALDGRTDDELTSAQFTGTLSATGERLTWIVVAGVPQPDPSYGTVWALGGAVEVDAVSGEVTVLKH
jgi:hypothetical protein